MKLGPFSALLFVSLALALPRSVPPELSLATSTASLEKSPGYGELAIMATSAFISVLITHSSPTRLSLSLWNAVSGYKLLETSQATPDASQPDKHGKSPAPEIVSTISPRPVITVQWTGASPTALDAAYRIHASLYPRMIVVMGMELGTLFESPAPSAP
ncbi:hypothetical protein CTheo_3593 [Ceratobasidium theobromae]|uniref:Effector protein n=1 Tax=Ceratobasidium theobromae TaxID=1582974 RepID=A0A5N5QN01_9AGAM|nr:hypothetical protein CTheo_3593 [Ceratobasidium theobromae]